jgi:hypothetical protein
MRPVAKCAAVVLIGGLLLPGLIQHAPAQQSKEQTRPASESREQYQKRRSWMNLAGRSRLLRRESKPKQIRHAGN